MSQPLTAVSRVRDRMGFTTSDLTDPTLTDFTSDQQAFVERTARRTYEEGDDDFELARSVVTDLAAMMALVRLTGGTTSGFDDKFLRDDFITTIDRVQPSTTIFQTKLGITIYETEQATAGRVLGFSSRRAGRFTVKTRTSPQASAASRGCRRAAARQQTQRFDLGAGGGPLQKGVTVWELIDAVVTRGDAVAKCTV